MDFEGADDNPMTAFISFPQVLGHEVWRPSTRPAPRPGVTSGQRVVLNPWLSCGPRGIAPSARACEAGDCRACAGSFHDGRLSPGIHTGNSTEATGGFAELLPAHQRMSIPIPDERHRRGRRARRPVLGVAARDHPQPAAARAAGPSSTARARSARAPPRSCARSTPTSRSRPSPAGTRKPRWPSRARRRRSSLPSRGRTRSRRWPSGPAAWCATRGTGCRSRWPGGIDVVYDTVGAPATLEVGLRVLAARGTIVQMGLSSWARASGRRGTSRSCA